MKLSFLVARAFSQPRFVYRQGDSSLSSQQGYKDYIPQYYRFNDLNTLSIELGEEPEYSGGSLSLADSLALTDYSDNNFSHVYSRIQSEYVILS